MIFHQITGRKICTKSAHSIIHHCNQFALTCWSHRQCVLHKCKFCIWLKNGFSVYPVPAARDQETGRNIWNSHLGYSCCWLPEGPFAQGRSEQEARQQFPAYQPFQWWPLWMLLTHSRVKIAGTCHRTVCQLKTLLTHVLPALLPYKLWFLFLAKYFIFISQWFVSILGKPEVAADWKLVNVALIFKNKEIPKTTGLSV